MTKDYELSDLSGENGVGAGGEMGRGEAKGSGCYVSVLTGFILALLAILIALIVGLIVHFAEKDSYDNMKEIACSFPAGTWADAFRQMQQGPVDTTTPPPSTSSSSSHTDEEGYRLPSNLRPLHYDLELTPDIYGDDPAAFSFQGNVAIQMECVSVTREIVMNAKNLSIPQGDVTVSGPSGNLQVTGLMLDDDKETITISLGGQMEAGQMYTVSMSFSGPLTDDLAGLYLSKYKRGNETVYLATTQFESPDAREAFPCFDEPAIKANFTVTLVRRDPMISLSNTKIAHTTPRSNGWIADTYEMTPPMSTYLLAFIVCDFERVTGTTPKGIEYGVWARKELSDKMEYALKTGMTIIDYYGDVFGTDFPLQKQDMIAIPDFAAGAMENWGLITYREKYLFYQENATSEQARQMVTLVIAHELAHQWFGNLVTLAWWDDLWLNEGFAEFVEYIGMDKIDPDWKVWEQFNIDVVQYVFEFDQIVSSHPLFHPAKTVEEMEQYFDSISYEKGASVIRMIEFCLGKYTFRRGLQRYLQQHKYGNAKHTDLWNALAEQAREESKTLDIADIMDTWTLQMGFPVVSARRNYNGDLVVSQKRFLINPDAKDPEVFSSDYGYQWHVPLTMTSSNQPDFNVTENDVKWLSKTEKSKTFTPWTPMPDHTDAEGWFLVNVQQLGYYRVNYDDLNWQNLVKQLMKNHSVISAVNRAQIIDDAWNLASAGELSVEAALSTLEYLEAEEDYVPWAAASKQMHDLRTRMSGTTGFGALNRFIQDRIRPLFAKLGLDDTGASALQSYTRAIATTRACGAGVPQCTQQAALLFKQWTQDPENNPISPTVRRQVYCTAVSEGGESDWLFILTRYRQEQSPSEKDDLRRALACTKQSWLLSSLLNMSLSGQDIRRDDATGTIGDVANNAVGTRLAWDFVRANWDLILRDFAQSNSRLKYMINSIVSVFRSDFFLQQLQDFMKSKADLGRAEVVMQQALETLQFNRRWYDKSYSKIVDWLKSRGYNEFEGSEADQKDVTPDNVRLPSNLRPLHYDITIEPNMYGPDPSTFTFTGQLTFTFHCVEPTDQIVLHIDELTVSNISVMATSTGQGTTPQYTGIIEEDMVRQFLIVYVDSNFAAGQNYSVSMDFEGPLDNKTLNGLYLSSYKNATGHTVYLATTQFEPTDARKAFPCMDEPGLKATFSITLIRRTFNLALSNMPVEYTTDLGGGRIADHFMMSKPMSSYLVALIVCDFASKTKNTSRGIKYEVWSKNASVDQVDFALDFGVEIIDFYERYFNVNFPLPKQSMAAIPDFAAGAMENWGLITYRETRILFKEGVSSLLDKEHSATTIAHELGHMWFGDLVSPKWWDDLWLNEGFATFMQYLSVDSVRPEWKLFETFLPDDVQVAMSMDGLVTSHPVYVPVATPSQINEIFDAISYSKGASIIRMIRFAIGENTFKQGLTTYLQNLSYKNANHTDLWRALNNQAQMDGRNVNVGDVMDTWTLQMNFPVVKATVQGQTLTLTQERFLQDPSAKDPLRFRSPFGYKWDIPFTFTTSTNTNFAPQASDVKWFYKSENTKTLTLPSALNGGWLLGNVKVMGYYRMNYDTDNWMALASQLQTRPADIDPMNRAQLIDDSWSLASGGYIDQGIALKMVQYLEKEDNYVPWVAARNQLNFVAKMLSSTEIYGAFMKFMANKTSAQYQQLRIQNSSTLVESKRRSLIVGTACKYDEENCVTDALSLFGTWSTNSNNNIPPEVRSTVYCTALRRGSADDWQLLYDRFLAEPNVNEKDRLQGVLACSSELWVLKRLLNRALYSGDIRSQDSLRVMGAVALNPAGTALTWSFLRNNWDFIIDRYRTDPFLLKRLVTNLGSMFTTEIQLQEIQAFVDTHPDLGVATRAFQTAMESTRSNMRWMEKNYDVIKKWLEDQGYPV